MDSTTPMDQALAELRQQDLPDFVGVSKKYQVQKTTLWQRYKGKIASRDSQIYVGNRALTKDQEHELVGLINKLTLRGLPPPPRIVKNLAEKMRGCDVGKNWVGEFVKRHNEDLL